MITRFLKMPSHENQTPTFSVHRNREIFWFNSLECHKKSEKCLFSNSLINFTSFCFFSDAYNCCRELGDISFCRDIVALSFYTVKPKKYSRLLVAEKT